MTVDPRHLAAYAQVCGFTDAERSLPLTYPQVLAFRLAMDLMTRRDFPLPPMGLVHIRNQITRLREISPDEPLVLRVWAEAPRPHPRGTQIDLVYEAAVPRGPDGADGPDGPEPAELVWTARGTYLRRERRPGGAPGSGSGSAPGDAAAVTVSVRRPVPGDIGRRYAAVSGDRNPIHLSALTARPFGFQRAIAHGMWLKARALADVADRLPPACSVDVRFRSPVLLPAADVEFAATVPTPPGPTPPGATPPGPTPPGPAPAAHAAAGSAAAGSAGTGPAAAASAEPGRPDPGPGAPQRANGTEDGWGGLDLVVRGQAGGRVHLTGTVRPAGEPAACP